MATSKSGSSRHGDFGLGTGNLTLSNDIYTPKSNLTIETPKQ
jgi:hypothetical protein